jgi:uncharacterized tellurite resistance protein B-like protein
MANQNFLLTLAKVIIAAAWADGEISNDEINSLKDLLFRLPDITGREWAMLEMYLHAPIGSTERARLVEQLQSELRSPADKNLAIQALSDLIEADGKITPAEQKAYGDIKSAIDQVDVGLFGLVGRILGAPLDRRTRHVAETKGRELFLEDFIKNKVFYEIRRRLAANGNELDIPEDTLRRLSLAGGLMARVAFVDKKVTPGERDTIIHALHSGWDISSEEAAFVAEVAVSEASSEMDYYRLTRSFFDGTTERERVAFMDVLFAVAAADGFVSYEEIEETRNIANSLKLTHKQFIDAKLKVPADQRAT